MALAIVGLGFRLAFLHLGPHEDIRNSVERSRVWRKDLKVRRGSIFDRCGEQNILALDLAVKDVCADPQAVVTNGTVRPLACELAEILSIPTDEVAVRLNHPRRRYTRIKRFVLDEEVEAVRSRNLEGVFFEDSIVRTLPEG